MTDSFELPIRSMDEVVVTTTSTIESYMDGTVPVLKTRWKKVNDMLLGGLQFGMVYVVAGASGHGKSMFLNNLMRDFTSPVFNEFKKPLKILHFSFEMSAEMELIRRISALSTVGLDKILKADLRLNDTEKALIYDRLGKIKEPDLYFVENPGNRIQIAKTIKKFVDDNPDSHYVICLDHTLLVTPVQGEDEIQTLAELGKMCIEIRKRYGAMVLLLSQLNDKIEGDRRRDPDVPNLHYPMKTDIHGSKQLYHAADCVLVIHQPSLLGLEYYGRRNIPTQNLVALHCLKNRHGQTALTLLTNNLKNGSFEEYDTQPQATQSPRRGFSI
jgi:replicative DNA helicase